MRSTATPVARAAVMLVLAGQGTSALRRTLEAVTAHPGDVWCAVPSEEEALAAVGHARTIVLDPWPGQRKALATLIAQASIGRDDVVQTVIAGSVPDHHTLRRSMRRRNCARLVIPAQGPWRSVRGLGVRTMRWATLRPGAGMTLRGSALHELASAGWFRGTDMTLSEIRTLVGPIRLARSRADTPGAESASSRALLPPTLTVTVLIPAYNEQSCIGDTVRSVYAQSRRPDEVLVVDDGSDDRTGEIASHIGARVLRTGGTGSKGAAINHALASVISDVIILVDADTRLHPEAIHHLMRDMEAGADATHGAVMPAVERGFWARGRLVEYAVALRFFKRVQRSLGQIMVLSGCILAVRTEVLRAAGGFQSRTMVEDLDMTWTLHQRGLRVEYSRRAVAYPIEPATWTQYKGQMRRWARGLFQTVGVHAKTLHRMPALALIVVGALWDAITAPLLILVLICLTAFGLAPSDGLKIFVMWQVVWTTIAVVVASTVIGVRRSFLGAPSCLVMSLLASYLYFEAFMTEWVLRRRLETWVKGH